MSKITYRKSSNEEALKKYWRSSFVFVEGTGVILEHVPESNETYDQEKVGSRQDANVHSGKNVQGGKNLLPVCCLLRVHSDASPCICSARHTPPYSQGIPTIKAICGKSLEAAVGFEPTNNGFANRRLRPLGYAAISKRPGW